jgi:hypothetical protein
MVSSYNKKDCGWYFVSLHFLQPKNTFYKIIYFILILNCMVMVHVPSLHLLITFGKSLFGNIMQEDLIYFRYHFVSFKKISKASPIWILPLCWSTLIVRKNLSFKIKFEYHLVFMYHNSSLYGIPPSPPPPSSHIYFLCQLCHKLAMLSIFTTLLALISYDYLAQEMSRTHPCNIACGQITLSLTSCFE